MSKRSASSYEVHPHWKFLQEHYGMEAAFDFFGPYQGASIFPKFIDQYHIEVKMPLVHTNTNYVGVHFGGSLYAMCDPFYMFLLMKNLGDEYIVWDKGARIEFLKPGTGTVQAVFKISPAEISEIKDIVSKQKKTTRYYEAQVTDEKGAVVAQVFKELYIRKMPRK